MLTGAVGRAQLKKLNDIFNIQSDDDNKWSISNRNSAQRTQALNRAPHIERAACTKMTSRARRAHAPIHARALGNEDVIFQQNLSKMRCAIFVKHNYSTVLAENLILDIQFSAQFRLMSCCCNTTAVAETVGRGEPKRECYRVHIQQRTETRQEFVMKKVPNRITRADRTRPNIGRPRCVYRAKRAARHREQP